MQPLTTAMRGTVCTVKWALGLPEVVEKLRELKIEQGSQIQVIEKSRGYLIVRIGSRRIAMDESLASRIQV